LQAALISTWTRLDAGEYFTAFSRIISSSRRSRASSVFNQAASQPRLSLWGIANLYQQLIDTADHITIADVRLAADSIDRTWGNWV